MIFISRLMKYPRYIYVIIPGIISHIRNRYRNTIQKMNRERILLSFVELNLY